MLGPTVLLVISAFFIGVVLWGYFNPVEVRVVYFDAGAADSFQINQVRTYPEQDLYIVGMPDGRLRAIDGRVESSGCSVTWLSADVRGQVANPSGLPGVFEDPCTDTIWSMQANAISGTNLPLRTPHIDYRAGSDGRTLHAFVELINP